MNLTYYDVLGVDDDATAEEIKRAYRKTSLKFHPDQDGNSRQFRALKTAYDVLGDPASRIAYDLELKHPSPAGSTTEQETPSAPDWGESEQEWGEVEPEWGSESTWEAGTASPPPVPPAWSPPSPTAQPRSDPPAGPTLQEQEAAHDAWQHQVAVRRRAEKVVRRRSHDKAMLRWAVALSVTVLIPWLLGHQLIQDTPYHPRNPAVFDTAIRSPGRYFGADWAAGTSLILGVATIFVLARPWSGRLRSLIAAGLILAVLVTGLVPYSRDQWTHQEAVSASRLQNSVYPLPDSLICGHTSVSFGTSSVEPGEPKTTYSLYSTRTSAADSCTRVELWEGWRKVKQVKLRKGQSIKPGATIAVNDKKPLKKTVFTVRLSSGKTVKYLLPELLQ